MTVALWLCALLSLQAPDDDAKARLRLAEIVRKCADDDFDTRVKAERELLTLPARLVPEIDRLAREASDVEVKMRLRTATLPAPWARILPGTIGEARKAIEALESPSHPGRNEAVRTVLAHLATLKEEPVLTALGELLADPESRSFALEAFSRFPPRDAAPFVPLLQDPNAAVRASEVILAAGDPAVVPALVPIFTAGGNGALEAGRLLWRLGAAVDPPAVAAAIRQSPILAHVGARILGRSGAAAEDVLLELLESPIEMKEPIARVLAEVGGPKCLPAVRRHLQTMEDGDLRNRVLSQLRDPDWARVRLEEVLKNLAELQFEDLMPLAACAGPLLREPVRTRLEAPGVPVSAQKKLLPLLGAVGTPDDLELLVSKLGDRRLSAAAAEGLELLGDARAAGPLMDAYKRSGGKGEIGRPLLAFASPAVEEDLVEILSDLPGYVHADEDVIRLAALVLTPRVRQAMWKGVVDKDSGWDSRRTEAVWILSSRPDATDVPWIEKAKEHPHLWVRGAGLAAALRSGDAEAAQPLAELIAGGKWYESLTRSARFPQLFGVVPAGSPAEGAWADAIAKTWRANPDWHAGAAWLAARGNGDALQALRRATEERRFPESRRLNLVLAALGEKPAMERLFREAGGSSAADEHLFGSLATPEARKHLLAMARGDRSRPYGPAFALAARLALPEGRPLFLAAVSGEEGRFRGEPPVTASIAALGRLGVREAIPDLRILLRSAWAPYRAAAAEALAALDDRAAVHRLAALVDDPADVLERSGDRLQSDGPPKRVWAAAIVALEKITGVATEGKSGAERRRFWRDWHARNRETWK